MKMGRTIILAAALLLAGVPVADADPPDGGQQCPDQQSAQSPDQQCQAGDVAGKVIDKVQDGADKAQRALQQQQQQQDPRNKPLSQVGYLYLVNGVPTCFHNWDVGVAGMVPVQPVTPC
ncbi:hypothetical protein PT015_17400 [Candidatus Mycobacterium wuenschmannii]|uniref:Secreted protein n=1 Tax=Candidatus Mycobacterium wuenschmannii TaxID=3027808 RepID=A0ABY8VSP6_9MYCO|nr:hypothetical protein [Candidatus Mycobacterium wuenschmannii]WIM86655.1 hypothetical protein PT015_17400 [Candidatus Mycobacterium wuenschmannii]